MSTADLQRLASEGSPTMKANIEAALAPAGVTLTKSHENHHPRQTSGAESKCPVRHDALAAPQGKAKDPRRVSVSVTSYRRRLIDPDNLVAKYFVDLCRYSGIIRDDSAKEIDFRCSQTRVKTKAEEETVIEITFPDDPTETVQDGHGNGDYSPEVISADHARKLENALRILWGDVTHLKHWVPDPCRRLVEAALANN